MTLPTWVPAPLGRAMTLVTLVAVMLAGSLTAGPALARRLPPPKHPAAIKAAKPAPLPPAEPFPADAPSKSELSAGGLRATIASGDLALVLPVGGSAFVTVSITDPGGNQAATLLAEAESGSVRNISGISGPGLHTKPVSGGLAAEIPLTAKGPTTVTVELELKSGSNGPDGKPRSRLRLTVLPLKGGHDDSIVSFRLVDCSGDYKSALAKISQERRERMKGTLDAVSGTEGGIPATWLFPPPKLAPAPLACRAGKGKRPAKCAPATPAKTAEPPAAGEARIYEQANAVLQLKGALPQFQRRTQPLRQASYTLLNSLRLYMEQDPHPALCSGVDAMMQYYQSRTSLLRSTIDETKQALASAQNLAATRVSALGQATSQATPVSLGGTDTGQLINRIGAAVLPAADASALAADSDVWSKLRTLRVALGGTATADLSEDRRAAVFAALGMVEASQYLAIAVAKYARLDETVYGTMSAILDAHRRTCVCAP